METKGVLKCYSRSQNRHGLRIDGVGRTSTTPTTAHTSKLIMMSVTMIAIAGKGSLLIYGTREWYFEAFFDMLSRKVGLFGLASSLRTDGDGEVAILKGKIATTTAQGRTKKRGCREM